MMRKTVRLLLILLVVWVAFVFSALMALYHAARYAPDAPNYAFDNAGKWYVNGY